MNYVFFFPDEMRASSVSCYGNKHAKMPNFDKLADEGVRFENCIVQNPVCSPSRSSLMSGLYVHNFGHRTLWHLLRQNEPSLFRYLKQAGFDIAWFGKNDLYSQDYLEEILDDIDEKRHGYTTETKLKHGPAGRMQNPYDISDKRYYSFLFDAIETPDDELIYDEHVARGVDFLESRKPTDKPFFLYLPIVMPHPPYKALKQFYDMYDPQATKEDIIDLALSDGKPSFVELIRKYRGLDKLDDETLQKIYSVYLGMNSYVDAMLGTIMDTLEKTGLAEDTTVIVSSDHGDWAGNYGLVEKWPNAMDDSLVKVPLIIRSPDCKKGHVVREQVELFDIMPTVASLSGVEITHTHFARDLSSQLKGAPGDPERAVFCEGGYNEHEPHCSEGFERGLNSEIRGKKSIYYPKIIQQVEYPQSVCRTTMIRTLSHKLILRTSGENELYDLVNDSNELKNVYNDNRYHDVRQTLESRMLMWYLNTSDTVPTDDDIREFGNRPKSS